jgi:flavin-dependent dehydrogenase
MVTVLYRDHGRGGEYAGRAERFFRENLDLDIRNVRRFGSFGNFFLRNTQIDQGKYYVGEAGGFQDCLWGFGMRYAMASGFLAAQSLADGTDYDRLWKKEFRRMLETSMINRFLIEGLGHAGYRYLARRLACGDPRVFLGKHYHYSFFKHLLLPLARKRYERSRRKMIGTVGV